MRFWPACGRPEADQRLVEGRLAAGRRLASSQPPPPAPPSASYRLVLAAGMAEMGLSDEVAERHLLDLDLTS